MLNGEDIEPDGPPPLELVCGHTSEVLIIVFSTDSSFMGYSQTFAYKPFVTHFVANSRRIVVSRILANTHPRIPASTYPSIFPLYNPLSVDFVIFWEIPSEQRSGHILVSDIVLGAGHAALREAIEEVESAGAKRIMYAETQREKAETLEAIRDSEWNAEMNPIVVNVKEGFMVEHDFSQG